MATNANALTPEQEKRALKAEMTGFIAQDVVGRKVTPEKAASFYKRVAMALNKRASARAEARKAILATLNPPAAA